jgi:hypothetical protein
MAGSINEAGKRRFEDEPYSLISPLLVLGKSGVGRPMRQVQTSKARRFRAHVECTFACQFRPPTLARSSDPMGRAVAVASELCKRVYEGAFTVGSRTPEQT